MGKGRKPIAAEIKEQTGAYKKNPQRRNAAAPIADGNRPQMPDYFGELETEKWVHLCEILEANKIMSTDTIEILIAYCTSYAGWRQARAKVLETGLALPGFDKEGNIKITKNGYVAEMHKFRDQMNRLLPELGLTPASRQKLVSVQPEKEESAFSVLLDRMQGRN